MEVLAASRHESRGPRIPLFVTFYSFKGGVGRTLAMLNVACILAGLGRRVLMIDFDLEAPGLTLFQDKQREAGISKEQLGLIDAISEFLDNPWASPLGNDDPAAFFDRYVSSLEIPEGVRQSEEGRLDLIPSGRLDADYESRMYGLAFDEMFEEGVGRPLFERFKNSIRNSDRYDYVLIDSRTGFSDEGFICTRFLGDYLVVLTGLNRQNVMGTTRFLRRSNIAEREEQLALVASPVPMYYENLRAERIAAAKERIAEEAGLDAVHFAAEIPYHPILALEEDPTVRSLEGTDLFEAYEKITETLRTWAEDQPEERMQQAFYLLGRGKAGEAVAIIEEVEQEDPRLALRNLRKEAHFLVDQEPEHAVAVLKKGLSIARKLEDVQSEYYLLRRVGNAYHDLGRAEEVVDYYEEALAIAREAGDRSSEGIALGSLGISYRDLGRVEKAIDYYEEALAIFREVDDRRNEGITLNNLGNTYHDLGRVEEAIDHYEEALAISREVGYRSSEGIALGNLGNAYRDLERVEEAIDYYEEALAISREIEDRHNEGISLGNLGEVYALIGQKDGASIVIEEARHIAESLGSPFLRASIYLDEARARAHFQPERAREALSESWPFIMERADAFEQAQAHVLRARLRAEQGNYAGAAKDAQAALDFYRPRGVDSIWSREAEELLHEAQAHTE